MEQREYSDGEIEARLEQTIYEADDWWDALEPEERAEIFLRKDNIEFVYLLQPPKKWTFEQPKLKRWIEEHCRGKVLNLFAGKTKLNVNEFRVDSSDEFKPDFLGVAEDFIYKAIKEKLFFDTIILDPPYNLRKSREKYGNHYIGSFTKIKNSLSKILNPNGIVITLGYDTVGMSKKRGFRKIAICLVCHNGDHNDTLVVIEKKEGNSSHV